MFALYIVARHPFMKGTVFDRAPVAKVAETISRNTTWETGWSWRQATT
jgi:hypothetical protein